MSQVRKRRPFERPDVRIPGEMLGQQRGAKVVEDRFSGSLQGPGPDAVIDPVVGGAPPSPMDHARVPLLSEPSAEPADMPLGDPHTTGSFRHAHCSLFQVPQNMDPITISETQVQHLLPRCRSSDPPGSNKHRKRTFLN